MAHNLADRADGTGKSFFGVLTGGWHGLGRVIGAGIVRTLDEALEAAGAAWEVATRPLHFEAADYDASGNTFACPDGFRAVVRTDTGSFLGTCKGRYFTLQNRTIFGILQILVDNGLATWETGGVLGNGERLFASVKWVGLGEEIMAQYNGLVPYGTMGTSHDGSLAATVYDTTVRTVCENTLYMGLASATQLVRVKHTATAEVKLADAASSLWGRVLAQHSKTAESYRMLRAVALDTLTFKRAVLDVALPMPTLNEKGSDRAKKVWETISAKQDDRRAIVTDLWHNGTGHSGDSSAWEAWQGLIQAIDHNDIMPLRSSDVVSANLFGTHGDAKARVYTSLLSAVANK